tara:strand:- start:123 stop:311 length:189 start_codon:yes stop_codon:yes gene_type:complete
VTISDSDDERMQSFARSRTDCPTRLQVEGELPNVLIGTFTHDQSGFTIWAAQTMSKLTNVIE